VGGSRSAPVLGGVNTAGSSPLIFTISCVLMNIPLWALRLVAPSQAYLRSAERIAAKRRGRWNSPQEANAEIVVSSSIAQMTARSSTSEHLAKHIRNVERVKATFDKTLYVKALELSNLGRVSVPTFLGTVQGRIVRFRFGHSVLELWPYPLDGHIVGPARTEITRSEESDTETLADYLADAIAHLGEIAQPVQS